MPERDAPRIRAAIGRRVAVLAHRDFRRLYVGQVTSLLGTWMSSVAVTFAVLGSGVSADGLGVVMAAGILPQVVFVLGGGVLADRIGRRPVMLGADALCCAAQAALAVALLAGRPPIWLFAALAAFVGTGQAFFGPALNGLMTEIAPRAELGDANALYGLAQSATRIIGPSLAGLIVALAGPAVVIAVDAASYGVSVVALALLRPPQPAAPAPTAPAPAPPAPAPPAPHRSLRREAGEGWAEFRSRTWLWVTTLQFALFNLITWGPYLLLGPVLARAYLGGARGWGLVMAVGGAGAVLGGLSALGRRPRRPLVVATLATFGYPAPCFLLALHAAVGAVAAGAFAAGIASALFNTYWTTTLQQQVPADRVSRASSFSTFGGFGVGMFGLVIAGPAAALAGPGDVLGAGAAWAVLSSLVVLSLPCIRAITWSGDGGAGASMYQKAASYRPVGTSTSQQAQPSARRKRSPRSASRSAGSFANTSRTYREPLGPQPSIGVAATLPRSNSSREASPGVSPSGPESISSDQPPSGRTTG
jgi:MFS family permease